ncbi:hypothetical protein PSQ19_06130 [Devosia algicola]|uniref:Uncharacterized protein n=1 Tax=Devosia algicola TaxID=3026418 RepID=A0ABY7YQW5_9HYPH|nr:hypothetical protein [Devosia algicola]WDR03646.1 hypothetical protein PSQ19_06130 [Devosia algicola]
MTQFPEQIDVSTARTVASLLGIAERHEADANRLASLATEARQTAKSIERLFGSATAVAAPDISEVPKPLPDVSDNSADAIAQPAEAKASEPEDDGEIAAVTGKAQLADAVGVKSPSSISSKPVTLTDTIAQKSKKPTQLDLVEQTHKDHPDWPARVIGDHLGIDPKRVRTCAVKRGIKLPRHGQWTAAQAAKTKARLEAKAQPAPTPVDIVKHLLPVAQETRQSEPVMSTRDRVAVVLKQYPRWTPRMIAHELGANYETVKRYVTELRNPQSSSTQAKPQFANRKEMVAHYGDVAKRLGK